MNYQPACVEDVWCAVLKRAVMDHRAGYQRKGLSSAYTFLRSAGLIDQRGQFTGPARGAQPQIAWKQKPPLPASQGDPNHATT